MRAQRETIFAISAFDLISISMIVYSENQLGHRYCTLGVVDEWYDSPLDTKHGR